jgi:hypothetical protein
VSKRKDHSFRFDLSGNLAGGSGESYGPTALAPASRPSGGSS